MKKLLLFIAVFAITGISQVFSQATFGVSAGLHSLSLDIEWSWEDIYGNGGSGDESESESGFMVGVFAEFSLSDEIDLRPSLLYSEIEDYGSLMIPVMVKYKVADQFFIQGGPQINYLLDDIEADEGEFSKLAIQIALGAIYEINDSFDLNLRYGFGVTSFEADYDDGDEKGEAKVTPNSLTITLGYKFE